MSVLNLNANSIYDRVIRIGYEGENIVTQIDFNLRMWIDEYGLGGAVLLVLRHGDTEAYPVPLVIEDGIASWVITKTDTAKVGRGAIQLKYVVGEKVKKSPIFDVSCLNALDDSDTVPDPYDSWLATLTDLSTLVTAKVAESLVNADIAQMAANISAQAASTKASEASTSAQTATTKASEATASAQSAASSAQTATDKATLASQKAAAASESASIADEAKTTAINNAQLSVTKADEARNSATAAANSATSAQEYDESAQQSAVNAQTSATNAAASEAQAQHYAENASAYLMTDTEATNLFGIAKGVV